MTKQLIMKFNGINGLDTNYREKESEPRQTFKTESLSRKKSY